MPAWWPDGYSHHGPIRGHETAVTSLKAWSLLLLPLCSLPGLLLVNKPQLCKPLQSSLPHLHKSCVTQPQGLDNSPSVQGRPCHTFCWARELQGWAFPCEHGSRRLSHPSAAPASFPGTSGGCVLWGWTGCSLETISLLWIYFFLL